MSKKTNRGKRPAPAVVLFGLDEAKKPHAAYFEEAQLELAIKAANLMGLGVLKIATPEQGELAGRLPAGRIYANGRGFVPYVRQDLYAKVTGLAAADHTIQLRASAAPVASTEGSGSGASAEHRPTNPAGSDPRPKQPKAGLSLPSNWDEIDVGHIVIAQETDPKDGWWDAIVIGKAGDMLTLRWRDFPHQRKIVRNRLNVGLHRAEPTAAASSEAAAAADSKPSMHGRGQSGGAAKTAEAANRFPRNWDEIDVDHVVLAREYGPLQAWWEAVVVKKVGDDLTLRWRDYPGLPNVVWSRSKLGLFCPNV